MMFFDHSVLDALARGVVLTTTALFWIIFLVRIVGLRSFSKMTNFDFVMTVAMGSLLAGAGQTGRWVDFLQTVTAMASLFAVQWGVAKIRQISDRFENLVQNKPVILMRNGVFLEDVMAEERVAKDDLIAKLREANVLDLSQVRAVVLETTGGISVLHGDQLQEDLLNGIRRPDKPENMEQGR